jgi:hypothetical protein
VLTTLFKFCVGRKENCTLQSWYKYGLQQFTGYMDFETNIDMKKTVSGISVDLGKVKYMAEVFVNGKSVGACLWPPFVFDLSKELKPGGQQDRGTGREPDGREYLDQRGFG